MVGAGLAGLAAARALADAGLELLVLEARDRVGGRLRNERLGDDWPDAIVEVGGQWIGPTQFRLHALARELGVGTFATHGAGEHLVVDHRGARRYTGTIPPLGLPGLADLAQAQFRLDRLARRVPLHSPWAAPRADELDSITFETWIRRNARSRAARDLLRLAVEAVWACDARDVSLLHVLFYVHSAGGFDALIDTEGGAQAERFVGGSWLLADGLAQRLGSDRIRLGAEVREIEQRDDAVMVHTRDEHIPARHVVVAIPPVLAGRIAYSPALPAVRDGLTQRMAQGSVVKCIAVYDTPFWRDEGLSGQALLPEGPCKILYDNSPPAGSPGVLLGFLEARAARRLTAAGPQRRREEVLACLARVFGPRAARPERYVDVAWAEEPYSRGCYGGYLPPGGWTDFGPALRQPVGRIHWAGAETATVWNGYMDGAVTSGERAAREVIAGLSGPARSAAAPPGASTRA